MQISSFNPQQTLWANINNMAKKTPVGNGSFDVQMPGSYVGNLNLFGISAEEARSDPFYMAVGGLSFAGASGFTTLATMRADSFTADNPIMLVRGRHGDGTEFEVEVDVRNVNPKNASLVELIALDGYLTNVHRLSKVSS